MARSEKQTLFDVLKPLTDAFGFYGLNWKQERNWFRRALKASALVYWSCVYSLTALILVKDGFDKHGLAANRQRDPGTTTLAQSIMRTLTLANVACFFLCLAKWNGLVGLMDLARRHPLSPAQLSACLRVRNSLVRPTLVSFVVGFSHHFLSGFRNSAGPPQSHSELALVLAATSLAFLSLYLFMLLMPLVAATVGLVAHYVSSAVEEGGRELAEARSPWRKARLSKRLMERSGGWKELAEGANGTGAGVMFVVKSSCLFLCLLNVYAMHVALSALCTTSGEQKNFHDISVGLMHLFVFYPVMLLVAIYLWFLCRASAEKLTTKMGAGERTLFDVLQPLTKAFGLYGLDWKQEPNLFRRALKATALAYWTCLYSLAAINQLREDVEYRPSAGSGRNVGLTKLSMSLMRLLIPANALCFFLCLAKRSHLGGLIERSKRQALSPAWLLSCLRVRNGLVRPVLVCCVAGFLWNFLSEWRDDGFPPESLLPNFLVKAFVYYNLYAFMLLMPLVAATVGLVAHYVGGAVEEGGEELAEAWSPWRKARLVRLLLEHNNSWKELAEAANAVGAGAMFVVKSSSLFLCLLNVYGVRVALSEEKSADGLARFFVFYPLLLLVVVYMWFLRRCSSLKPTEQLAKAILKSITMGKGERFFTSHPQLLKLRLTHLLMVLEMSMQPNYFVILNEGVTDENLISVFVEMIDLWNTINAKIPIEHFYK